MNGVVNNLSPEVVSLLKRRRMLGNWALLTMIFTGFAGLYLTHGYNDPDPFLMAMITSCVVLGEAVLGCYHLSRGTIPVNNPNIILTELVVLVGAALSGWLLYYSWERYFTSRDEDAGLAVVLIALYIFFKPMELLFVYCNYKRGVYHRILKMNDPTGSEV
ncbi:hypothetical protein [Butyricimonas paravirosa]|uniref:hypothetical protein n=1 Tax=Butyricimonas paravirosa TaxID=1472417 RepID=UPI00210B5A94|nr:hypothetical protein [Butyricimonas paravirosa]MCQ4874230.1 hypothetical protein [Butyricimonas paravirosa]